MGATTTFFAPVHRVLARFSNPGAAGFPLNAAPSLDFLANGIQDHRLPYNSRGSSAVQPGVIGWYGTATTNTANQIPAVAAVANIAAAANAVSGTPLALVSATGAGITALSVAAPALQFPTGRLTTAGVAIGSLPSIVSFGTAGNFTTSFYNRDTYVGRCVSITGVAGGTGGNILVSGYDIYGYPMSELIPATAGATTKNGKKAFKIITSAVPQFSDAHNYSVGTADIFGFGMYVNLWESTLIRYNGALITASTGFTAGDATTPATTTTGDVRGTYAVQSATDGTKRLSMGATPTLTAIAANPTTGLFGQPQV